MMNHRTATISVKIENYRIEPAINTLISETVPKLVIYIYNFRTDILYFRKNKATKIKIKQA